MYISVTFELPLEPELFFMAEIYGAPQRTYEVKLKMKGRRKIKTIPRRFHEILTFSGNLKLKLSELKSGFQETF